MHAAWFALGMCIAGAISWILERRECKNSKDECRLQEELVRNETCMQYKTNLFPSSVQSSTSLSIIIYSIGGAVLGLLAIALIAGIALHLQERRHSRFYNSLIRGALIHQTRCHASVPETRQNWKPFRWQAHIFSCKALRKIGCLNLDMVNITGVGLTLYRATMVLFLGIAVLCRIGNGISSKFLKYIEEDWCSDSISESQGSDLWAELAQERALALLRLFMIISLLHLYHLYRQGGRRDEFDRTHAEMSDYAFIASGFPRTATQNGIMEYLNHSLQSLKDEDIRWKPEIVGVSIGYDFRDQSKLIQHLVEEHLIDVASRWFQSQSETSESDSPEGSEGSSEGSAILPASLSQQRITALQLTGWAEAVAGGSSQHVLDVLRSLENSGTVVIVCRWPCETAEVIEKIQQCLDEHKWEGVHRIKVVPMPCEPPSMIWNNFATHLFEPAYTWSFSRCGFKQPFYLLVRQRQILAANVLIVGAFILMLVFYYFLYKMVYGKGRHPEQILTTIVTCCCAVGNVLLNQLVWFASQQVGYRVKTHFDTFVLTWYAVVVLTNMGFNFFVICWTAGPVPEESLAAIQFESDLAGRLVAFLRGSLISYAIWPLYYVFYWLKGFAQVLYLHLSRSRAGLTETRCKWMAESASEPPEWYMQYDYAGIVVLEATSFMCLFIFGFDSWRVFSWDVMWVCGMYFLNKYIYLGLSKETFYTSRNLDTCALEMMTLSLGILGGCVCHWGFRAGQPVMFVLSVAICSLLFLWAFDRILSSPGQRGFRERVWYDELPYEQLERMYSFNWFNVNPVHMMRVLHGVEQVGHSRFHQQVVWQHGRGYLQPDLCFDYEGARDPPDSESDQEEEGPAAFAVVDAGFWNSFFSMCFWILSSEGMNSVLFIRLLTPFGGFCLLVVGICFKLTMHQRALTTLGSCFGNILFPQPRHPTFAPCNLLC